MYRYSWLAYEINWHWSITEVSDLEFNLVLDGNNVVFKVFFLDMSSVYSNTSETSYLGFPRLSFF